MEYTKGKWKRHGEVIETDSSPNGHVICVVNNVGQKEFNDDVNLIAASPRMIEFIQKLASEGNKEASSFIQTLDLS